jgi:hypothetical protein
MNYQSARKAGSLYLACKGPASDTAYGRIGGVDDHEVHRPHAADSDDRGFIGAATHAVVVWRAGDAADEAAGGDREPGKSAQSG